MIVYQKHVLHLTGYFPVENKTNNFMNNSREYIGHLNICECVSENSALVL